MNQLLRRHLAIGLIALVSVMGLSGCTNDPQAKATQRETSGQSKSALTLPVEKQVGNINVSIDPRIELLTAIQSQAGDYTKLLTKRDFTYRKEVFAGFKPYRDAPAVKTFSRMAQSGFAYDAPPTTMLFYSMPPTLAEELNVPSEYTIRAGGEAKLKKFMDETADFAKASDFNTFYNTHTTFYENRVNEVARLLEKEDLIEDIDNFYAMPHGQYKLVLSLMSLGGGYGPSVMNPDGTMDIYGIIGPTGEKDGMPQFNEGSIRELVWHEFSHSYVNPLATKNKEQVQSLEQLFEPIRENMTDMAYSNWEVCLNEHIIRAINVKFTESNFGKEKAMEQLDYEYKHGFVYIKPLYEAVCNYESKREQYKRFDQYYPELLKALEPLCQKES